MRRLCSNTLLGFALLAIVTASSAGADVLVTTDGSVVETKGPWQQRGRMVVFTLANGQLSALRAEDVDFAATTRWREALAATAAPLPEDAASAPIARIVITDADVAHARPVIEAPDTDDVANDDAEATAPAKSSVRVTAWDEEEPADGRGRRIFGTLRNDGNNFATGITIQISVYDNDGAIAGTQTTTPVRTSLRPGESTTFSLQFAEVYLIGATRMIVKSLELELDNGGTLSAAANDFGGI
ncbi:MAG: FxLYD domain-containing protein [Acidobacteria bacterium]|nr:FxLYD domain-containing protein [Acidobacteriota bacterium]